jgi:Lon protease-like protein
MNLLITDSHLERLPLFPLPKVVFFPNTLMPLHVFEPRYRELARHCIARNWPMGVVLIRPGHEHDHLGTPPIADVAGVGHVVQTEELGDGRLNIILQGMVRVRILEELAGDAPYRVARVRMMEDQWTPDRAALMSQVAAVRACLVRLMAAAPHGNPLANEALLATRDPATLADALCAIVFPDPVVRQDLLANPKVHVRLERVIDRLTEIMAQTKAGSRESN